MWPRTKKGLFESGRVLFLPVDAIQPNPSQPRRAFDQPALEELASSIQELGVLQPLTVRRREGQWELVAGERRLRAARMAGLETVPCLSIQTDSQSSSLLALVENLQRCDLHYMEEAAAIAKLISTYEMSQEEAARSLGRSQSAVANKLRLLRLSPACVELLRQHDLTERHARALLRLEGEAARLAALRQRLAALAEKRVLRDQMAYVQDKRMELAHVQQRLGDLSAGLVAGKRQRVSVLGAALDAMSPLKVLGRGFALVTSPDGSILRRAQDVPVGSEITARLREGALRCRVEEAIKEE